MKYFKSLNDLEIGDLVRLKYEGLFSIDELNSEFVTGPIWLDKEELFILVEKTICKKFHASLGVYYTMIFYCISDNKLYWHRRPADAKEFVSEK